MGTGQADSDKVLHQDAVEDVVHDVLTGADDGTANAFVAAATTAHTVSGTFSNTEIKGFLDALGTKINSLRTAMINSGQLPPS